MALTTCPDCGTQMSTKAAACPRCGRAGKSEQGSALIFPLKLTIVLLVLAIPVILLLAGMNGAFG